MTTTFITHHPILDLPEDYLAKSVLLPGGRGFVRVYAYCDSNDVARFTVVLDRAAGAAVLAENAMYGDARNTLATIFSLGKTLGILESVLPN